MNKKQWCQGTELSTLQGPIWEKNLKECGCVCNWLTLLYKQKLTQHSKSTICQENFLKMKNTQMCMYIYIYGYYITYNNI